MAGRKLVDEEDGFQAKHNGDVLPDVGHRPLRQADHGRDTATRP
ncbi:MAG: hypothetical protein V4458_01215 [Pseudomonadota bacterium]